MNDEEKKNEIDEQKREEKKWRDLSLVRWICWLLVHFVSHFGKHPSAYSAFACMNVCDKANAMRVFLPTRPFFDENGWLRDDRKCCFCSVFFFPSLSVFSMYFSLLRDGV